MFAGQVVGKRAATFSLEPVTTLFGSFFEVSVKRGPRVREERRLLRVRELFRRGLELRRAEVVEEREGALEVHAGTFAGFTA